MGRGKIYRKHLATCSIAPIVKSWPSENESAEEVCSMTNGDKNNRLYTLSVRFFEQLGWDRYTGPRSPPPPSPIPHPNISPPSLPLLAPLSQPPPLKFHALGICLNQAPALACFSSDCLCVVCFLSPTSHPPLFRIPGYGNETKWRHDCSSPRLQNPAKKCRAAPCSPSTPLI